MIHLCDKASYPKLALVTNALLRSLAGSKTYPHYTVTPHFARMLFTLAYNALPCALLPPTAQKPLMPSSLRAALQASHHFFKALLAKSFLALSERFLLTILPVLLFVRLALVKPLRVFSLLPLNTAALARLPLATL